MIYDAFGSFNPKMWFYLLLKNNAYTLSLEIGKIFILFLCSFQGTCLSFCRHTSLLLSSLGQRISCIRFGQSLRRA